VAECAGWFQKSCFFKDFYTASDRCLAILAIFGQVCWYPFERLFFTLSVSASISIFVGLVLLVISAVARKQHVMYGHKN
jgi:hypothetical protein